MSFFQDRVSQNYLPGPAQTTILLISASWVARITGMSYQRPRLWILFILVVLGVNTGLHTCEPGTQMLESSHLQPFLLWILFFALASLDYYPPTLRFPLSCHHAQLFSRDGVWQTFFAWASLQPRSSWFQVFQVARIIGVNHWQLALDSLYYKQNTTKLCNYARDFPKCYYTWS
jgi:hypothetical protein